MYDIRVEYVPIVISYFIFYHISRKRSVSAIGSIIGIIVTLIPGYRAGLFWILDKNIDV